MAGVFLISFWLRVFRATYGDESVVIWAYAEVEVEEVRLFYDFEVYVGEVTVSVDYYGSSFVAFIIAF